MQAFLCDAAAVLSERSTCIQYPSGWTQGVRRACKDDWAPGLDMNQTPSEYKTKQQSTLLCSRLSCCAAHNCSAVQSSWTRKEWLLNVSFLLFADIYVQTTSASTRLGPLDANTNILSLRAPQLVIKDLPTFTPDDWKRSGLDITALTFSNPDIFV